ncbi:hypothetical protein HZS_7891, partial [Henneguya salminicola]
MSSANEVEPIARCVAENNEIKNEDKNGLTTNENKKQRRKKNQTDKKEAIKPKSKKQQAQSGFAKKLAQAQLELERIKKEEEEEERKIEEERQKELERQRIEEEIKERKKLKEKEKRKRLKQEGKLLSKTEKEKKSRNKEILKRMLEQGSTCIALNPQVIPLQTSLKLPHHDIIIPKKSSSESSQSLSSKKESDEIESELELPTIKLKPTISDPVVRIQTRKLENKENASKENLRSPIICVMGHVDTGKTKILDKLRNTHVQDSEAGGITQQIGVTNVPLYAIKESVKICPYMKDFEYKIRGLSIIDTPGHFSFRNLRSLGSSLCDMAILIVDIMHSVEPQTEESIKLLLDKKTPFVVALNKIDLIVGWQSFPGESIEQMFERQSQRTKQHFDDLFKKTFTKFAELGLNIALFNENINPKQFISAVPTSARTGDGVGDLIACICQYSQKYLSKTLIISKELEATVMEVKVISGLGPTIDVILVNGSLSRGDRIIVPGLEGPIVSQIRALLTPQPMKEMRVKGSYIQHDCISICQGVKISGSNLEQAIAGLPIFVAQYDDEIDYYKNELSTLITKTINSFEIKDKGVYVQASTLAVFPCILRILPESVFKTRDPIIVGVHIEEGTARIGTPLCVPTKNNLLIGTLASLEINHKAVDVAIKGQEVCIKIANFDGEAPKLLGRHFDISDQLVSK